MIKACTRSRTVALQALIALAMMVPASACSSGAPATPKASKVSKASAATSAKATCQQLTAVLTNGPDPGADPVGYAEAQILPLRQIRTPDAALSTAIGGLASAYSGYSAADGTGKTTTATLTAAINRINSLCPGAGATP
jgi:hypothetical protein